MAIRLATGPRVDSVNRKEAEEALKRNKDFPEGSEMVIDELEGHWVAAVHVADEKEAGKPPFGGGGPADSDEEAPGPKSEGPDDAEPSEGPEPGDDDESPDHKPPGAEHGEDGKKPGGEDHLIHQLLTIVETIATALGIPPEALGGSPVPGHDGPPAPAGPPHPGGPPGGAPGGPDETIEHTRALKPGEAPPGGTPVGAPAFSSVKLAEHPEKPHPWNQVVGVKTTFQVSERIPEDMPIARADEELRYLATGLFDDERRPYKLKQIREARTTDGHRVAHALISSR